VTACSSHTRHDRHAGHSDDAPDGDQTQAHSWR
jgi:hypothetical protein